MPWETELNILYCVRERVWAEDPAQFRLETMYQNMPLV